MTEQKQEGVTQYQCQLDAVDLHWPEPLLSELNAWRGKLLTAGWVGQNPQRYSGLGFGNLSLRQPSPQYPEAFLITASQTGHLGWLNSKAWSWVVDASFSANWVKAKGCQPPSSETLSHAALYQANPNIQAVVHIHAPELWQAACRLEVLSIPQSITYGSTAMAQAIYTQGQANSGLLVMLGHQDGLLAWGGSLEEACEYFYALQAKLRQQQ